MLAREIILQERYRIVGKLGAGGMGEVYKAIDMRLKSMVAVKKTLANDDSSRRAFEREANLLANLSHPSLPKVSDHFVEGDGQFLVMEFVEGDDLAQLMYQRGVAFPPREVLGWADQLLDALEYLHSHNPPVVHRDIKPSNIKLGPRGQLILLDFGLAKGALGQMSEMASKSVFGFTPVYAPLEQIHASGTDPKSDLYSLGTTLYHLITGAIPSNAPRRYEALEEGLEDPLRPASQVNPEVTTDIAEVLSRAMALKRKDRFVSALAMRAALKHAEASLPPDIREAETSALSMGMQNGGALLTERYELNSPMPVPAMPGIRYEQVPATSAPNIAPRYEISHGFPATQPLALPTAPNSFAQTFKTRRSAWIVAAIVLLAIAGLLTTFVLYNRGKSAARTVEAYFDALYRGNLADFKKTLSRAALSQEQDRATRKGAKSLDEHLGNVLSSLEGRIPPQVETRNERTEDDRATIEVRAGDGDWMTMQLVKEDGEWKLAKLPGA